MSKIFKILEIVLPMVPVTIEIWVFWYVRNRRPNKKDITTREAAVKAMDYLLEWAKWMTGILTAAIGALAYIVLDDKHTPAPLKGNVLFFDAAFAAFLWLGTALFCAAWLLSGLASMSIRIRQSTKSNEESDDFDFYELPLYGFLNGKRNIQPLPVKQQQNKATQKVWPQILFGEVMAAQFWFWFLGLLALGITVISMLAAQFF